MDKLPVNIVDIAVFAVLLLSAVLALFRGFVGLVLATASWGAAVLATIYFFPVAEPFARQYIQSGIFAAVAAGLGVFLPTLVFCSILTHLISERVKSSAVSAVDRSLGFVLGLGRGALIVVAIFWATDRFIIAPAAQPSWYAESRTKPLAVQAYSWLQTWILEQISGGSGAETRSAPPTRTTPVPNRLPVGSGADSGRDSGYKPDERKGIESLIRNQEKP